MKNGQMNLAICISGGGTTMREILRTCNTCEKDAHLNIHPALVISSKPDAGGIEKAKAEGLDNKNIVVIARHAFENPYAFGEAILHECRSRDVDLIAQCGFLPIMPANVIAEYRSMIFNQHPGPLDQARLGFGGKGMYGRRVHHAVIHFAKRVGRPFQTEATTHRVTDEVDGGAVLGRKIVEIMEGDDAEKLAARVLPHEHTLVLETILKFSELGDIKEIHREQPLIRPGEEALLEEAKEAGIKAFPKG